MSKSLDFIKNSIKGRTDIGEKYECSDVDIETANGSGYEHTEIINVLRGDSEIRVIDRKTGDVRVSISHNQLADFNTYRTGIGRYIVPELHQQKNVWELIFWEALRTFGHMLVMEEIGRDCYSEFDEGTESPVPINAVYEIGDAVEIKGEIQPNGGVAERYIAIPIAQKFTYDT